METFYCIYTRGGVQIDKAQAPSKADAQEVFTGEVTIISEPEAKKLSGLLNKEFKV